jgi:two-component system, cell cycle sensor histidine kinase and response regulator CckA
LKAANGEEALKVAGEFKHRIDLLLTDVVMPKMGGKKLSEELQKTRVGLKVLYMSGYTSDAIVHHRVLDEGVLLLEKPFSAIALLTKVNEVLGVQRRVTSAIVACMLDSS